MSHTFILREIQVLRRLGFRIHVASINEQDRAVERMPADEQEECAQTFYVKKHKIPGILHAIVSGFLRNPANCLRSLALALQLSGGAPRSVLMHLFYWVEATLIVRWMNDRKLAHLHVHFATAVATVGMLAAELGKFRFSMTVHGPDEFFDVSRYSLPVKIEKAAFVCCIGAFCRSQLMLHAAPQHWEKLLVAPLGVDPEEFQPASSADSGTLRIVSVGRLAPQKGMHILLQAAAELANSGVDFQMDIIGSGPLEDSLADLSNRLGSVKQVRFLGAMNRERISGMLRDADLFVLASFAEGIPVALMEAMAMEVPCVSTYVAGIPELIESGSDGFLVAPGDSSALAQLLLELARDPERRRRVGANGRSKVLRKYHLDRNVGHLANLFRQRVEA